MGLVPDHPPAPPKVAPPVTFGYECHSGNRTARKSCRQNGRYLMSMTEILQRIAEGADVEAFRKLFEAYAPRVKTYMMRQGADANTAEELAQETLLTVWRKAALYSGEKGSATTWIFTIARNLKIDKLRREMRGSRCLTAMIRKLVTMRIPMRRWRNRNVGRGYSRLLPSCRPISTRLSFSLTSTACHTVKLPTACDCRLVPSNRACGLRIQKSAMPSRT